MLLATAPSPAPPPQAVAKEPSPEREHALVLEDARLEPRQLGLARLAADVLVLDRDVARAADVAAAAVVAGREAALVVDLDRARVLDDPRVAHRGLGAEARTSADEPKGWRRGDEGTAVRGAVVRAASAGGDDGARPRASRNDFFGSPLGLYTKSRRLFPTCGAASPHPWAWYMIVIISEHRVRSSSSNTVISVPFARSTGIGYSVIVMSEPSKDSGFRRITV